MEGRGKGRREGRCEQLRRYKIRGRVKRLLVETKEDQMVRLKDGPERNLARERAEGEEKPVA